MTLTSLMRLVWSFDLTPIWVVKLSLESAFRQVKVAAHAPLIRRSTTRARERHVPHAPGACMDTPLSGFSVSVHRYPVGITPSY